MMLCCVCDGSCNHTGPHSYCAAHYGKWAFFNQPTYNYCPYCGKPLEQPLPSTPYSPPGCFTVSTP